MEQIFFCCSIDRNDTIFYYTTCAWADDLIGGNARVAVLDLIKHTDNIHPNKELGHSFKVDGHAMSKRKC